MKVSEKFEKEHFGEELEKMVNIIVMNLITNLLHPIDEK
jgi:hypothetical protein